MTNVVHVHKAPFDVYVGRKCREFTAQECPFGKPLALEGGGRVATIIRFAVWWLSPEQAPLRARAREECTGKVLGCWCAPQWCHGDIIAGYCDWREKNPYI